MTWGHISSIYTTEKGNWMVVEYHYIISADGGNSNGSGCLIQYPAVQDYINYMLYGLVCVCTLKMD